MVKTVPWTRLAWLEPFWITLLAPSVLLPGRFWTLDWHTVLVLLLFLFWPVRFLAYGRWSQRTPTDLAILALALWLPVALWASVDTTRSWVMAGYLCLGLVLYYALVNWPPTRRHPHYVAGLLLAGGVLLLFLGPLLTTNPIPLLTRFGLEPLRLQVRALVGETLNPNVWAGALLLIVPYYLALAITPHWTRHGWARPLAGLLAAAAVAVLVLTDSRGAYIALCVSMGTLIGLRWRRSLYLLLPLLLLLATASVFWIDPQPLVDYLFTDTRLSGWSGRPEIWLRAVSAIQDFPWTGIGLGLFDPVIPQLYPYFVLADGIEHAHNLFLQVGVDMGIPGSVAYLAIILCTVATLARPLQRPWRRTVQDQTSKSERRRQSRNWALAAGTLASLVAMGVHGFVDAVTWGTKLAFLPWLLFALATNIRLTMDRRRRKRRVRTSERTFVQPQTI